MPIRSNSRSLPSHSDQQAPCLHPPRLRIRLASDPAPTLNAGAGPAVTMASLQVRPGVGKNPNTLEASHCHRPHVPGPDTSVRALACPRPVSFGGLVPNTPPRRLSLSWFPVGSMPPRLISSPDGIPGFPVCRRARPQHPNQRAAVSRGSFHWLPDLPRFLFLIHSGTSPQACSALPSGPASPLRLHVWPPPHRLDAKPASFAFSSHMSPASNISPLQKQSSALLAHEGLCHMRFFSSRWLLP